MLRVNEIRHNIISVRITNEELVTLKRVAASLKTTTSKVIRGALEATVFANGIEEASGVLGELVKAGDITHSGEMSAQFLWDEGGMLSGCDER